MEAPDGHSVLWAVKVEGNGADGVPPLALELLPEHERAEVARYTQPLDRQRAACSRLMMRALGCRLLGARHPKEVAIQRTKGGKPFFAAPPASAADAPNLNFNLSHEGAWVVLVSDTHALVGVDVAAPPRVPATGHHTALLPSLQARFKDVMAPQEWELIGASSPHEARTFQVLWSLKEAYIKARGDGLGFSPLSRARFELVDGPSGPLGVAGTRQACLVLDGQRQDPNRWRFDVLELPGGHVLSVARGPPSAAVDANGEFKATFRCPDLDGAELAAQLARPLPELRLQCLEDLLTGDWSQ